MTQKKKHEHNEPVNSYWEERSIKQEKKVNDGAKELEIKVIRAYHQAQEYLTEKVKKLFHRAQLKSDMSESELKAVLNHATPLTELAELGRLAKDITNSEIQEQAQKKLNALAFKERITRLEDLKAKSYLVSKKIADVQLEQSTDFYIDTIHNSYKEAIAEEYIQRMENKGVAFEIWNKNSELPNKHKFKELSTESTKNILESHWQGSNYSKRIWGDTEALAARLEELFTVEAMTGMSERETVKIIAAEFDRSIGVARRLIRTEANYMANQARLKAWRDSGVKQYMLVAVLDLKTSCICQKKDGKIYDVKDAVVNGKEGNYPPFHPWCRTVAIAYYGKRSTEGNVMANDPISGKTMNIPRSTTYNQWMNKLKENYSLAEIEMQKKKIRYLVKDNKEYRSLKTVIGKENSPKSLDDYQTIKYNGGRDWKLIRLDYQRRNRLKNNPELKLPNAESATIDNRKFTEYLFEGSNEKGLIKGRLISDKLGYSIDNYKIFKKEILKRSKEYPVTIKHKNGFGVGYEQKMIMYGKNNEPINIVAGWTVQGSNTHMSSIMIKEAK